MELKDRIIAYILNHHPITYTEVENVALGKGFSQLAVMDAMELVHKDKRVTQSARGDEIVYRPYIAPPVKEPFKSTIPYPEMNETNDAHHPAFADLDYSYLFLTPEELDKYKAEIRGVQYIPKKKYEHKGKQSTERSVELSETQRSLLLAQQQHGSV